MTATMRTAPGPRLPVPRPPRAVVRSSTGTWALQSTLVRRGLGPVAGVDEAGRGACAGPLVIASCVLRPGDVRRLDGLNDSKLMTAAARDRMFDLVLERAVDHAVVVVDAAEVDVIGVHVANIEGMRRAVARLAEHPGYVLTDGFRVPGLTAPNLAVVKGDQAVACVAAASVLAKVTRDRIMAGMHEDLPVFGFDVHKGYATADHSAALVKHGPSDQHRWSYANVVAAAAEHGMRAPRRVRSGLLHLDRAGVVQNGVPPVSGVAGSQAGGARTA
ncbi:ribonuclease HII [Allokutzneria sp. A3M-2-11 16]|uniref:ribonuclease HII n=1 Tax=Allokutzneria sp. A3M-2-11 16 TaxID=2962043 RepID=UPI0020B81AAE|nr:ribonuclease HII [Allokutzneria sp. A3M-2-11 16]MCP3797994.1 ribonuclease HII [Allokutzneria sp. A3M-2-11 16]